MATAHAGSSPFPLGAVLGVIVSAAVGAGAALTFAPQPPPAAPPDAAALAPLTARLEEVEQRLDRLERRLAAEPARAAAVPRVAATPDAAAEHLQARVDGLERMLHDIQQRQHAEAGAADPGGPDPQVEARDLAEEEAARARRIQQLQETILDPASNEQQKRAAWAGLRDWENAWNDAVVAQMTHLGLTSPDPEVRADVWRQADGRSRHDALVPALLQALQADAVDDVREEAAETLVEYAWRPDVLAALRQQLAVEANEGVRRYLEAGLRRGQQPR